MIELSQKGNFKKFNSFTEKCKELIRKGTLNKYGELGVQALSKATPVNTGLTSESWYYTIEREKDRISIVFSNSNIQNGVPIALVIQYGHLFRGVWIEGQDYITKPVDDIFAKIIRDLEKEVHDL